MLILISPAKILNLKSQKQNKTFTLPEYTNHSKILMNELHKLNPADIAELLDINMQLANLNFERHVKWHLPFTLKNSKQAIFTFNGEVYRGINIESYSEQDLFYLQDHLRILSALYGVLRPLDLIQPYRLEMGIQLKNERGNNVYEFWGNIINDNLNNLIKAKSYKYLINLASSEYFKVVKPSKINAKIITPFFMETRNTGYKTIVVYTKKARGLMTSFIVKNKITEAEEIKLFDLEGYMFNPSISDEYNWGFIR